MNKLYAVVLWSDEPNNYSSIKISRIRFRENGNITSAEQLVDQIFEIQLNKDSSEVYAGKGIQVGSRAKMSKLAADLASEAGELSLLVPEVEEETSRLGRSCKKRKHGIETNHLKKSRREAIQDDLTSENGTPSSCAGEQGPCFIPSQNVYESCADDDGSHADNTSDILQSNVEVNQAILDRDEKDLLIEKLRSQLRRKEKLISQLKDEIAGFQPQENKSVDIGEGVMVSAGLLEELKTDYRHNPGIFLRKLMEKSGIFTLEEIANSSLTGQKHHGGAHRPRLDFKRFKVCKDFTIRKCKLQMNTLKMLQFKNSINNICTDARKRIKNTPKIN